MSPSESNPSPSTGAGYRIFVVATLSAAMAFSLVDRFALSLLFEPIKADLGLSDTQLGLLHGVAFGLFYATMGIPIAWLIDRWSRKWTIFWGIACWSVMTALCGLARSFLTLLGARVGVGVGEAALAPAGYSLLTDIVPRRSLATALSVFQMGALLGGGLAFLAGGKVLQYAEQLDLSAVPLLGQLAPWQLTFILLAAPGVIFLILLLLISEPKRENFQPAGMPAEPQATAGLGSELKTRWRTYTLLFVGNAFLIAVNYGNMTWMPSILVRQFDWLLPDIGLRFGLLVLLVSPTGVICGGLVADWLQNRGTPAAYQKVLFLGATLTLVLVFASLFARSAWMLFALIGSIQFASSIVVGIGPATVMQVAPAVARARVSAVYVFMINIIGLGLGPTLVGILSDLQPGDGGSVLTALRGFSVISCIVAVLCLGALKRHLTAADTGHSPGSSRVAQQ